MNNKTKEERTMELSTKERIVLNMIMEPQAGRYDTLKIVRKLREELSFSEEEIKEFELKTVVTDEQQQTTWPPKHATTQRDVPLGDAAIQMIKDELDKLNGANELTPQHVTLFEKFHVPDGAEG